MGYLLPELLEVAQMFDRIAARDQTLMMEAVNAARAIFGLAPFGEVKSA